MSYLTPFLCGRISLLLTPSGPSHSHTPFLARVRHHAGGQKFNFCDTSWSKKKRPWLLWHNNVYMIYLRDNLGCGKNLNISWVLDLEAILQIFSLHVHAFQIVSGSIQEKTRWYSVIRGQGKAPMGGNREVKTPQNFRGRKSPGKWLPGRLREGHLPGQQQGWRTNVAMTFFGTEERQPEQGRGAIPDLSSTMDTEDVTTGDLNPRKRTV